MVCIRQRVSTIGRPVTRRDARGEGGADAFAAESESRRFRWGHVNFYTLFLGIRSLTSDLEIRVKSPPVRRGKVEGV